MKRASIVLSTGVMVAVSILCIHFASPQAAWSSSDFQFLSDGNMPTTGAEDASVLLVLDTTYGVYGPYSAESLGSQVPADVRAYINLYGLPRYEYIRDFLEHGAMGGSPLYHSDPQLYRSCLLWSRYSHECQDYGRY